MQDLALGEEIGVVHEMGSVPQTAAITGIDRFLARDRVYDIYFRISSGWLPDITEPLQEDVYRGRAPLAPGQTHQAPGAGQSFLPRGVAPAHRGAGAQRTPLVGFPMLLEHAGRRPRSLAVNDDDGRGAATRGVVFMLRRDAPQGRLLTNCLRKSNGGGGETTLEKCLVAFTSEANWPMASCPRVGHVTPKRTCFSRALRSTKTIRRLSVRTSEPARPYARCQDRTLVFVIIITSCYGR